MKGAGACIKRPACTKEDYYQYQLPCDKGKVSIYIAGIDFVLH